MSDSFGKIWQDAKAQVAESAKKAVAAVKPHVTLDNAIKVLGVVNAALDAATKVQTLRPPPAPPPTVKR